MVQKPPSKSKAKAKPQLWRAQQTAESAAYKWFKEQLRTLMATAKKGKAASRKHSSPWTRAVVSWPAWMMDALDKDLQLPTLGLAWRQVKRGKSVYQSLKFSSTAHLDKLLGTDWATASQSDDKQVEVAYIASADFPITLKFVYHDGASTLSLHARLQTKNSAASSQAHKDGIQAQRAKLAASRAALAALKP